MKNTLRQVVVSLSVLITIVINIPEERLTKTKIVTATAGQQHVLHRLGAHAVEEAGRTLGIPGCSLTSVTVA